MTKPIAAALAARRPHLVSEARAVRVVDEADIAQREPQLIDLQHRIEGGPGQDRTRPMYNTLMDLPIGAGACGSIDSDDGDVIPRR